MNRFRVSLLRTVPAAPAPPPGMLDGPAHCAEAHRLRGEYIRRLAAFNVAARRCEQIVHIGMDRRAAEATWSAFVESCATSRAAWAAYRSHIAAHGCKRALESIPEAA